MQFLYPSFLWALTALAIPVIIHLFYFRRFKKVYFTNVRFLRELKKETSARSRLRNLLILFMRLGAIAALVFAFAQPFIPVEKDVRSGDRLVSVFVDNSFSMSQTTDRVPLLDQAREKAREIIQSYRPTDKFQILTNQSSGSEQFVVSQDDAIRQLEDIQLTAGTRKGLSIGRAIRSLQQRHNELLPVAYLLSDLQEAQFDDLDLTDTLVQWNLVPLSPVRQNNVGIDSAWFDAPVQLDGQSNQLLVRVKNFGDQPVENVRLTAEQNGQKKPEGTLDLVGGASAIDTINFQPSGAGWQSIQLQITDHPIQFDDNYYVAFEARASVRVLLIHDGRPDPYLKAAFQAPGYFILNEELFSRLNYSDLYNYDLVLLQEPQSISSGLEKSLIDFMENGGNTLIFPPKQASVETLGASLRRMGSDPVTGVSEGEFDVARINDASFVFNKVFSRLSTRLKLPRSKSRLEFSSGQRSQAEWLMRYSDGRPYLQRYPVKAGNLFVSSAPVTLEENDLVQQGEIFVPMLFRMAVSTGSRKKTSYTIGGDASIELDIAAPDGDRTMTIEADPPFIPAINPRPRGITLFTGDQVTRDGIFPLSMEDSTLALLAFNYDRQESGQKFLDPGQLKLRFPDIILWQDITPGSFGEAIQEMDRGIILWKWFVILALIFLALESLILRLWKQ